MWANPEHLRLTTCPTGALCAGSTSNVIFSCPVPRSLANSWVCHWSGTAPKLPSLGVSLNVSSWLYARDGSSVILPSVLCRGAWRPFAPCEMVLALITSLRQRVPAFELLFSPLQLIPTLSKARSLEYILQHFKLEWFKDADSSSIPGLPRMVLRKVSWILSGNCFGHYWDNHADLLQFK